MVGHFFFIVGLNLFGLVLLKAKLEKVRSHARFFFFSVKLSYQTSRISLVGIQWLGTFFFMVGLNLYTHGLLHLDHSSLLKAKLEKVRSHARFFTVIL